MKFLRYLFYLPIYITIFNLLGVTSVSWFLIGGYWFGLLFLGLLLLLRSIVQDDMKNTIMKKNY
jgi:hypothetical protein